MKKILCIIISLTFIILLCGCDNADTESRVFSQEITIVKLPSPPKCKTSNSNTTVDKVIEILAQIEKSPTPNDVNAGGWSTMIRIKIDGQELVYTLGGNLFTDADGRQYKATNCVEIEKKITKIYNELDVPEVDYP
ncbi:MAG: hypothetical protein E7521_06825 [Ruminococcaceae bacterium]|nr:hypothetical protein [Oscillospiraceae bacterium]